jgi:DNA-binding HxlR family transcriptional regulator
VIWKNAANVRGEAANVRFSEHTSFSARTYNLRRYYQLCRYKTMRLKHSDGKSGCSVEVTLSVIGGVWKPVILFHLLGGKKRFMELTRLMPNTTQRMLTLQLRELEADGVIVRHVFPQVPPKVEYSMSALGESLAPVLISLRDWGQAYQARMEKIAGPAQQTEVAALK